AADVDAVALFADADGDRLCASAVSGGGKIDRYRCDRPAARIGDAALPTGGRLRPRIGDQRLHRDEVFARRESVDPVLAAVVRCRGWLSRERTQTFGERAVERTTQG